VELCATAAPTSKTQLRKLSLFIMRFEISARRRTVPRSARQENDSNCRLLQFLFPLAPAIDFQDPNENQTLAGAAWGSDALPSVLPHSSNGSGITFTAATFNSYWRTRRGLKTRHDAGTTGSPHSNAAPIDRSVLSRNVLTSSENGAGTDLQSPVDMGFAQNRKM
jgi:hypothetical protein